MSSYSWSFLPGKEVDVFLSFCCKKNYGYLDYFWYKNGFNIFRSYRCLEMSIIPINQRTREALEEAKVAVVMMSEMTPYTVGFLDELRVILEFQARGMDESDWLQKIADDIFHLLFCPTSNDSNALVAMDRHMKVVYDLLASEVNKDVRIIGIWGSAGVGKTTLARYISTEISRKFHTHVFIENVEKMKDKIREFEGEEDPSAKRNLDRDGHEIIETRRKHRKVVLIADDVNNIEPGKWIIDYAKWFAPGSRVILISQNQNLLAETGVKHVYEDRSLRYDEALQLFSHFAFNHPYPPSDFEQLSVRAVHLAGFLPLALKLLGSFLTGKDREVWIATLLKLKANRGENIMERWNFMENLMESLGKKRPDAAYILIQKESTQDTGQEEREAIADIMEG